MLSGWMIKTLLYQSNHKLRAVMLEIFHIKLFNMTWNSEEKKNHSTFRWMRHGFNFQSCVILALIS